jgi:hypothetical protein
MKDPAAGRGAASPKAAPAVAHDALASFLVDTLAQWNVDATVEAHPGGAIVVAATAGPVTTIRRAFGVDRDVGFRWTAQVRGATEDAPPIRRCLSLLGLLGVLRTALGVERQRPIRIASSGRVPVELG